MDVKKRTTLIIILLIALFMLWDNWVVYNGGSSLVFSYRSADKKEEAKTAEPAGLPMEKVTKANAAAEEAKQEEAKRQAALDVITVQTDVFKLTINANGGVFQNLELLKYPDNDFQKDMVLFENNPPRVYLAQTGLSGGLYPNHATHFNVHPGDFTLADGKDEVKVVMDATQNGVRLVKTLTFKRGSYVVDVNHQITNLTGEPINAKLYMQLVRDSSRPEGQSRFVSTFTGPAVYSGEEKFQKLKFDNLTENGTGEKFIRDTKDGWIAMVQHYFVSAFIPTNGLNRENYAKKLGEDLFCIGTELQVTDGGKMIQPQQTVSNDTALYMGPQDTKLLEKAAPGLDLVKDYGFLTVVAKPIFWLMNRIHDEVSNWGWTIVILTILIKLVLSPLSHMGYKSMARMRKFTPVIQRMKERYKDDPQTMKTEMIALYKREKINPAGGCLPMIVQIPVFLSLYWVLLASIEIRNAPWLGWIQNLAAPDPWYILPVVMAGTMFLQQKMSPPPPDPTQAKIMMFLPIAFSITFFFFPAGLVLYWIVNNILSIAHHYYINKQADKVIAAEQAVAAQAKPVTSKTKRR